MLPEGPFDVVLWSSAMHYELDPARVLRKIVARAETTEGDPIPRGVYHCYRRRPTVMVIRGSSHDGKSSLARSLAPVATEAIALDSFVYRIFVGRHHHTPVHQHIKAHFKADDLTALYHSIDAAGLTRNYAAMLAQAVAPSDETVVIEGLMTDAQVKALAELLNGRAIVWDASRPIPAVRPNR